MNTSNLMKLQLPLLLAGVTLLFAVIAIILTNTLNVRLEKFESVPTSVTGVTVPTSVTGVITTIGGGGTTTIGGSGTGFSGLNDIIKLSGGGTTIGGGGTTTIGGSGTGFNGLNDIIKLSGGGTTIGGGTTTVVGGGGGTTTVVGGGGGTTTVVGGGGGTTTGGGGRTTTGGGGVNIKRQSIDVSFTSDAQKGLIVIIVFCSLYVFQQLVLQKFIKNNVINAVVSMALAIGALSGGVTSLADYAKYDINNTNYEVIKAFNIITGIFAILFGVVCIVTCGLKLMQNHK